MQCPKCNYEPTMAEMQSSPDECPSCGVYYSKAKATPPKPAPKDPWELEKKIIGKVSAGLSGARVAVDEARELRAADQDERESIQRASQRKSSRIHGEVTVVDVDLPFWSMVQLMVKLALAAIPAAIIIAIIFAGFSAIFGLIGR